mgnify:CR=1 FL=1
MIDLVPLEDTERVAGGAKLTAFPVQHREGELCFGYRLDWKGRSLAYVTDTYAQPGAGHVAQIRGVDVLLHECYLTDGEPDLARKIGHRHTTPVAQVLADAGVGRLVLVYLNALRPEAGEPDLDRARSIFPRTELAFDRMGIELYSISAVWRRDQVIGEVIEIPAGKYLRCAQPGAKISSEQDILDLLAYSEGMESNRILLEEAYLHPNFFDLSTGLAGDIFHKLSTYHVKAAIVADLDGIKSERFRELVGECNRGNQTNFFSEVALAERWLTA